MPYRLPERLFHPLEDLAEHWQVGSSDIRQWLTSGLMTAALWLPVMSVIERIENHERGADGHALTHWEGYVPMSGHQCGRIFRQGWIALREFTAMDRTRSFRLPETSDDLIVGLGDLVVLGAERKHMEARYPGLVNPARATGAPTTNVSESPSGRLIDPTYRIVRVDGREHRFGETQAKILRLLAEAARNGEPWQSGKSLLHGAGSQGFSISNLFKRHPVWRELIASNQRGFYRLEDRFIDRGREPAAQSVADATGEFLG